MSTKLIYLTGHACQNAHLPVFMKIGSDFFKYTPPFRKMEKVIDFRCRVVLPPVKVKKRC